MDIVVNAENDLYAAPVPGLKIKPTTDPESKPGGGYTIELVSGSAVIDLLVNDHGFQKSWDTLYEACTWATVFQKRQFIAAWYQTYQNKHLPILIMAVERGQLKAVLPVVLLQGGRITGAGHYDAEYQTWLAPPPEADAFIKKALAELMKTYPGCHISFRFLPPETPLGWIIGDKNWRRCTIVQPYNRPVRSLKHPEHDKIFRSKHFRRKFNRLNRLGKASFECIRDLETFENSLHEMAIMLDFRQGAMFNKNHFKEDPEKKDFLLKLFHLQLLHITVLKLNGQIMAAWVVIAGKDNWVHLAGINCHWPVNAGWYSPGFLHLVLLLKQLAEEQIQYFDLTPGYDYYKEEFANQHDEVNELMISSDRAFRIKKQIRKWVHTRLIAMGIRPMTAELNLKRLVYLVRRRRIMRVIKQLTNALHKKRKQKLFLLQTYALKSAINIALHKDSLPDLLEFEAGKGITRWEFLEDAMYRFERGQHCYTCMENGRLLYCAWFSYPEDTEIDCVLENVYCHAAGKDQLPSFLNKVVIDVAEARGKNNIYVLADEKLF